MAKLSAKIIQKGRGTPKEYKRGPGVTGADRLSARGMKLALDLYRFAGQRATSTADQAWAVTAAEQILAAVRRT